MAESSTSSGLGGMSGGRGQYCCVPECGSAQYDKFGKKTPIALFKFPSKVTKPQKHQSWVKAISMYRRRGGGDTFDPSSKNTSICEHHFKEEHLKKAAGSARKTYTEDAVPSIFKFKSLTRLNEKPKSKGPAPRQRLALNYIASDSSDESESCAAINFTVELLSVEKATQTDLDQNHLENELNDLRTEKLNLSKELDLSIFSFSSISKDELHFRATTGLDVFKSMYLLELVEPGQNCKCIKFSEANKSKQQETYIQNSDCLKRGLKPKLSAEDELFMTLVWLKNAFPLYHLSWLFKIPVSAVSFHLISWVNLL